MKLSSLKKAVLLLVLFASTILVIPGTLSAQSREDICSGVGVISGSGCDAPAGSPTVDSAIQTAINLFSILVGVAAVIMIIIGGLKYITSGGDSNSTAGAKNTILYAIIGLVIVALSQVIVRFVLSRV